MAEAFLTLSHDGATTLAPLDGLSEEVVKKFKYGQAVKCVLTRARSYPFHRRWFALAKFAFDIWSETVPKMEYKGQPVEPNFDRFRKDLTIMAGYYTPVFNARGELRLEPQSISFANMEQDEFERLYSATINAILKHILSGRKDLDEQKLRNAVDQVIAFS